jgi:hypothetical protein
MESPEESSEKELCLGCLSPNKAGTNFCAKCGAPLTSYASTGPLESLFAEGHVYRQAVSQPRRLIVVLGVWVIFGSMLLASVGLLFLGWSGDMRITLIAAFMLMVAVAMLWKTTRAYLARPRPEASAEDQ